MKVWKWSSSMWNHWFVWWTHREEKDDKLICLHDVTPLYQQLSSEPSPPLNCSWSNSCSFLIRQSQLWAYPVIKLHVSNVKGELKIFLTKPMIKWRLRAAAHPVVIHTDLNTANTHIRKQNGKEHKIYQTGTVEWPVWTRILLLTVASPRCLRARYNTSLFNWQFCTDLSVGNLFSTPTC